MRDRQCKQGAGMRGGHALGHGNMALPRTLPMSARKRGLPRAWNSACHLGWGHLRGLGRHQWRTPAGICQTQQRGDGQRRSGAQQAERKTHLHILAAGPTTTYRLRTRHPCR